MNEFALARALHVIGVVLWIGGVAFVTTILLPVVRHRIPPEQRVAFFESAESRFAWQARGTTLLTGLSGLWMVDLLSAWSRFTEPGYWWMHAMTAIWLLFTVMLFVAEPLFLHRWFLARAERDPEGTFRRIERLHWLLLLLSIVTTAGAVIGAHGGFF